MSAIRSALFCHAPIVIPAIAGREADRVKNSTHAMQSAAQWLVQGKPDVAVVVSPHTPRLRDKFAVIMGDTLFGDFGDFGFSQLEMEFKNDLPFIESLIATAKAVQVGIAPIGAQPLDHGAMVPLYFMQQAGWNGPTVVLAFPYSPGGDDCVRLGEAITATAQELGLKLALVASGDMSHRLLPEAPAGFNPMAKDFDDYVCTQVRDGALKSLVHLPAHAQELRELAAEDVIDSLAVAAGVSDFATDGRAILSYEGPFGVGYLIAKLYEGKTHG